MLHEAHSESDAQVVRRGIPARADVDRTDQFGRTALHRAAESGKTELAARLIDEGAGLLISKGANVNAKDRNGDTPLHVAAMNGHKELYDLLILRGADASEKNRQGKTPADLAKSGTPRDAVMLSDIGTKPYAMIVTNPKSVRRLLRAETIDFEQIWIPEPHDVEGLESALRSCLEERAHVKTRMGFSCDYILAHLTEYSREYAGFFNDGKAYVICNMVATESQSGPAKNEFTMGIYDGGCAFVRVVFRADSKEVIQIDCNNN